jgi:hypothetical protein
LASWPLPDSDFPTGLAELCLDCLAPFISKRFHAHSALTALMMQAVQTSETLANFYQSAWCYNAEDSHLEQLDIILQILQSMYFCIHFQFALGMSFTQKF